MKGGDVMRRGWLPEWDVIISFLLGSILAQVILRVLMR